MAYNTYFPAFLKPVAVGLCAVFALAAHPAEAKRPHHTVAKTTSQKSAKSAPAKFTGSSIVMDGVSGQVLECNNCDTPRPPASMIKMLTAMVVFDAIRSGRLHFSDKLPLAATPDEDANAAVGLHRNYSFPVGSMLTVNNLISATAVTSAADATVTLSNAICGSDDCIATLMNQKLDTILPPGHVAFVANAHGMPDSRQMFTAREQALVVKHFIDHYPKEVEYFGQNSYYIGKRFMKGHNALLRDYNHRSQFSPYSCQMEMGKTGYFGAAGSNLAGSAVCDGHRVIAVRMGARSSSSRNADVAAMFDRGFKAMKDLPPYPGVPNGMHKPGILLPNPDIEQEPDNENQSQKISGVWIQPQAIDFQLR